MTVVTGALLHRRATDQAERRGDARAVILGDEQLTYEALEAASDRLARQLSELGVTDSDRVALIGPKHPTTIAAMLACLKLGALYVPVDAATPPARIALILRAAEPRAIVSTASSVQLLDALAESGVLGSSPIVSLDDEIASEWVRSSASSVDWMSLERDTVRHRCRRRPRRSHPVHVGFDRRPEGCGHHARQRDRLRRLGREPLRHRRR